MTAELTVVVDLVPTLVRRALSDVLVLPPTVFDDATPLADYGLDSISAIDLTVRLEEVFDLRIPHRDIGRLVTVDRIVAYIHKLDD
ncbi:acyl carrier protein [Gordonia insulae]|uniref:Acyl carrier protein n=1 Tax=Gordonia insulae TaxID=2420509 RepID=A0A3G8JNN5_9ACTN|nr:acyl carrier protein [Gordonia insulae]AZG46568.1 Acyl carrier protein [Gordonia insulae]